MRVFSACLLAALAASASPPQVDRYQLLRRLSLDLRGRVPSVEEYQALDGALDVPASTIEAFLRSDDFRAAMRRYHESLFWPNVQNVRMTDGGMSLVPDFAADVLSMPGRRGLLRGATPSGCGDFEQTNFDPAYPGEFRPDPAFVRSPAPGVRQEGWRWVNPYWNPATRIRACAYDAQESVRAALPNGQMVSCVTRDGDAAPGCGCGKGLRYCYAPGVAATAPVLASMREQLGRSVDEVTVGGRPYTDLILATTAWDDGTIGFWRKNLASHYSLQRVFALPDPGVDLAERDFTDKSFAKVERGGLHAGVLTLPGYLLRFQTNRGRANRFRIDFLCNWFTPPAELEKPAAGVCGDTNSDLTQRCNCRYCHQVLEPMAAHWGMFVMAGVTEMTDRALFPLRNSACTSASSPFCNRFYVSQPDAHNAGALVPYQFADAHPEIVSAIEGGPRLLAQEAVSSGQFAQCAVQKLWFLFLNQEMYEPGALVTPRLAQMASGFANSGYALPWLVEQIVSSPDYRQSR